MAYYFMVERKKGEYSKIDITKSIYFTKLSKYVQEGACALQEIDMFTSLFNDEAEMRKALYREGLLSSETINRPLSSRIYKKGTYKKVMYDFLYQKDFEYIFNPKSLIHKIEQYDCENNFNFLASLADNFQNYHDCNATASELKYHANTSLNSGIRSKYLDEVDRQGDKLTTRLLKLLIFTYYQKPNGEIIYHDKVKYLNLHHIIAYMNNYNKNHQLEQNLGTDIIDDNYQISLFDSPKPLTKIRKKNVIDGQISMFE